MLIQGTELSTINFINYIISLIILTAIGLICLHRYRTWQFSPLKLIGIGTILIASGSIPDLLGRFAPSTSEIIVDLLLRLSGTLFYIGSLFVIGGLLSTQSKIVWTRLMLYACFYAGMIMVYITPLTWVIYDPAVSMWIVMSGFWFGLMDVLTVVPAIELIYLSIKRWRTGIISSKSRKALLLLWFGFVIPLVGTGVGLVLQSSVGFVLSNILLTISICCFGLIVIIDPFALTMSPAILHQIIISRADLNIPIATYSWTVGAKDLALVSSMFSALDPLMAEATGTKMEEQALSLIQLGDRAILIERRSTLAGYLIVSGPDEICRIALRRLLRLYEFSYGSLVGTQAHQSIPEDRFIADVLNVFSFASIQRPPSSH